MTKEICNFCKQEGCIDCGYGTTVIEAAEPQQEEVVECDGINKLLNTVSVEFN